MISTYTISCKISCLSKQDLIWMVNSYLLIHGCMQYIMFSQLTYKANYCKQYFCTSTCTCANTHETKRGIHIPKQQRHFRSKMYQVSDTTHVWLHSTTSILSNYYQCQCRLRQYFIGVPPTLPQTQVRKSKFTQKYPNFH